MKDPICCGKPTTPRTFSALTSTPNPKVYELKQLDCDVVEDFFYINPIYFCSSKRIPLHLYLIFRKQLDEVLPKWVIQRFNETTIADAQNWKTDENREDKNQ